MRRPSSTSSRPPTSTWRTAAREAPKATRSCGSAWGAAQSSGRSAARIARSAQLAGLDRPHLLLKAQGAGPLAGGEAQGVEAGEGVRSVLDLLEERRQAELREVVELVAAGGAVAADAHGHPGAMEGEEIGHAGAELQVRAGAVDDAEAPPAHPVQVLVGDPDAMGQAEIGRQQPLIGEILDLVPPALRARARRASRPAAPGRGCARASRGAATARGSPPRADRSR